MSEQEKTCGTCDRELRMGHCGGCVDKNQWRRSYEKLLAENARLKSRAHLLSFAKDICPHPEALLNASDARRRCTGCEESESDK